MLFLIPPIILSCVSGAYINKKRDIKHLYNSGINATIPKILHQTWKNENFTNWQKDNMKKTKNYFKDWEYKFWDDDSLFKFVKEEFPDLYDFWNSLDVFIKKIDAIRYLWLYKYGGVYSDFDIVWYKKIYHLFTEPENAYIPVFKLNLKLKKGDASPAFLASGKENIFWLLMFRYIVEYPHLHVIDSTGPEGLKNSLMACYDLGLKISLLCEPTIGLGFGKSILGRYFHHENHTVWKNYKIEEKEIIGREQALNYLDKKIIDEIGKEKYDIYLSRI